MATSSSLTSRRMQDRPVARQKRPQRHQIDQPREVAACALKGIPERLPFPPAIPRDGTVLWLRG
jgi:hypothetical protein